MGFTADYFAPNNQMVAHILVFSTVASGTKSPDLAASQKYEGPVFDCDYCIYSAIKPSLPSLICGISTYLFSHKTEFPSLE